MLLKTSFKVVGQGQFLAIEMQSAPVRGIVGRGVGSGIGNGGRWGVRGGRGCVGGGGVGGTFSQSFSCPMCWLNG
jgi:hypothetical protein